MKSCSGVKHYACTAHVFGRMQNILFTPILIYSQSPILSMARVCLKHQRLDTERDCDGDLSPAGFLVSED